MGLATLRLTNGLTVGTLGPAVKAFLRPTARCCERSIMAADYAASAVFLTLYVIQEQSSQQCFHGIRPNTNGCSMPSVQH